MIKPKYLYGAAVQGIQGFIFQTDKLKDIVGGSELIEHICTKFFEDQVEDFDKSKLIIGAAGNIKYLFEEFEACQKIVANFTKSVMELAPGISISQAVVETDGDLKLKHINELEDKLKVQRNKQVVPINFGYLITERARNTGNVAVGFDKFDKNESIDNSTLKKRKALDSLTGLSEKFTLPEGKRFPFDFEEMVKNTDRSWIAVVHADGNGLGKVLQQLGAKLQDKSENELIKAYKEFSENLEKSTLKAANSAFKNVFINSEKGRSKQEFFPFRPIVLGGDDLTVIVRSEYVLDFTHNFLIEFEKETSNNLNPLFKRYDIKIERLTACAGIAYIKSSFPFHYGCDLAEQLCSEAKKQAKKINEVNVPSCLMFHKVQTSFIGAFDEIVKQELTCYDGLSFVAGPYYLNQPGKISVKNLQDNSKTLNLEGAPSGQLRKWLTERYQNNNKAKALMERTIQVLNMDNQRNKYIEYLDLNPVKYMDNKAACPYYDYISMASLLKN